MKYRVVKISTGQSALLVGLLIGGITILSTVFLIVSTYYSNELYGIESENLGDYFIIFALTPISAFATAYVMTAIGCWLYNKFIGAKHGFEIQLSESKESE